MNCNSTLQDSGLVGRGQRLNRSDVDIVFAKTRTKGERVLSFEQFVEALDALGQRCNCSLADIASQVLESGGPITRGTVAEGVRFYDDKVILLGFSPCMTTLSYALFVCAIRSVSQCCVLG